MDIVLDDMNKRRRRSSKSPVVPWAPNASPRRSPTLQHAELVRTESAPGSPSSRVGSYDANRDSRGLHYNELPRSASGELVTMAKESGNRPRSNSPVRPTSSRTGSAHGHIRAGHKMKRSGSNSSHSSSSDTWHNPRHSRSDLMSSTVLPSTKWRFLKHLSLADNSLTAITAVGLVPLANTLNSLDLSSNLFSQIPDSLASLTALRALNLSNCMIDSLHSLTRNPLPAITALNLRSNRLSSLAGIERLYPLERLDLRDNRLTDPTELARLTGIPELKEIWVQGNPFTKTHPNYRVVIFNLFRNTPGFTEDMVVDASGPWYNERRQLVERVPERENVPVVRQSQGVLPPVDVSKPAIIYDAQPRFDERPHPKESRSEVYTATTGSRRRRTAKRRIVDLSTTDSSGSTIKQHPRPTEPVTNGEPSDSGYGVSPDTYVVPERSTIRAIQQEALPKLNTSTTPDLRPVSHDVVGKELPPLPTEKEDWGVSGEVYKKKIEALRSEVGNGWLSVLSEEGKHGSGELSRPQATNPRPPSRDTIQPGRMLGSVSSYD